MILLSRCLRSRNRRYRR